VHRKRENLELKKERTRLRMGDRVARMSEPVKA
jgi:hypothetical protein